MTTFMARVDGTRPHCHSRYEVDPYDGLREDPSEEAERTIDLPSKL
jgi:hypothetical protein